MYTTVHLYLNDDRYFCRFRLGWWGLIREVPWTFLYRGEKTFLSTSSNVHLQERHETSLYQTRSSGQESTVQPIHSPIWRRLSSQHSAREHWIVHCQWLPKVYGPTLRQTTVVHMPLRWLWNGWVKSISTWCCSHCLLHLNSSQRFCCAKTFMLEHILFF